MFSDLLNETKVFKYQIRLKVVLKKYKPNGGIEFRPVYFNSATKTVTNQKFSLENAFQEILYRIDNWINEGSGWNIELIESQYINISTYRPLSGSSFVKLPAELKSLKKELIKIKNNDQKSFLWCHVRHTNPVKIHPERITREDKKLVNDLNYDGIEFSVREKDFSNTENENNICIKVFCYEKKVTFPIWVSDQKLGNTMDWLLLPDDDKSHYMYIKDFNRFMFHKTKTKNKCTFEKVFCSVLVAKYVDKT